jgi:hypothetical protein
LECKAVFLGVSDSAGFTTRATDAHAEINPTADEEPWLEDDDMPIPASYWKKYPNIFPVEPAEIPYSSMPPLEIGLMTGKRNKLDWVQHQSWSQKRSNAHEYRYENIRRLSFPDTVRRFINDRLQLLGKSIDDVFSGEEMRFDHAYGMYPTCIGEGSDHLYLHMRACPNPLPRESRGTSPWHNGQAKWRRAWHGPSPFSLFGVLADDIVF